MRPETLSAGAVAGLVLVVVVLSLTSLVFSGPLVVALPLASMAVLAATALMNLIVARSSSLPGSVIIPQDATSAVLSTALATAVVGLSAEMAVSTALTIIALASLATAGVMLVLGTFRMGSLIRYIPYPVIGGFLAGTGVLLLVGAADLITAGFEWTNARAGSLLLGIVLGATLLVVAARNQHPLAIPGMIIAAIAAFFAALWLGDISIPDAREMGLLGENAARFGLPDLPLGAVDWSAVAGAIPAIVTVPIVAVVSLLLNVGGLELVADADADLDAELRAAGLANVAGAAGGAAAGYHSISISAFGYRMGVHSRSVTVVVAAFCLLGAVFGPQLVAFLPVPVVGSLLAMLGFSFLWDWVVLGYRRMTHTEYLLMLVIGAGLVVLGFLIGIAFGLASAVLLFTVTYSRLDPIRHTFTGAERTSSVERSLAERNHLAAHGHSIRVAELEGFLFFGTAHSASRSISARLESAGTRAVVLDFRRVQGMDSTSAIVFSKLARELGEMGAVLVVSHASSESISALRRADLPVSPGVLFVSDLDRALEYCENLVLETLGEVDENPWLLSDQVWTRLRPYLDRIEAHTGDLLAEVGQNDQSLFIVERGRIAAQIPVGDRWQRVGSASKGGVLGEMSMYRNGQRSAQLVVEESGVVYRLTPEGIANLERTDPASAIAFHRALARVLSERLTTSNEFIRALAT